MDNVLNTIKDSCSNLKYNKLIDDQQFKFKWPHKPLIVSKKDKQHSNYLG